MIRLSAALFWLPCGALILLFLLLLAVGGPGAGLDRDILFAAQNEALVPAARLLSDIGSWVGVLILAALAAAWLFLRRRRRDGMLLLALMISERPVVELFKTVFDRARPDPQGHAVAVHSMAFPSGHSANAMALGLGLALIAAPDRWRLPALAAGLAFAAAVGGSRLVLGVHWPSDVLGGWAFGAAWTLLLVRLGQGTTAPPPHSFGEGEHHVRPQ